MTEADIDPWAAQPSEWMSPRKTARTLAERSGASEREIVDELISAIRSFRVPHRVNGVDKYGSSDTIDGHRTPPVVKDWSAVDWELGALVATSGSGVDRAYPLEVSWARAEIWFATSAVSLRAIQAQINSRRAEKGSPNSIRSPSAKITYAGGKPVKIEATSGLPKDVADDPAAVAVFNAMTDYARKFTTERGVPPSRDDAASMACKEVRGYPIRRAILLYRYLPLELRNPARISPS